MGPLLRLLVFLGVLVALMDRGMFTYGSEKIMEGHLRWRVGVFGRCSKNCGGGVQYRRVECIQGNQEVSQIVDVKLCPLPAPKIDQICNNHTCGSLWSVGQWSHCSTSCGQGQMKRRVICMTKHIDGTQIPIEEYKCTADKPDDTKNCFLESCKMDSKFIPLIRTDNSTFIQLKPVRSINLRVGSNAVVIPKTRVTIRCPVKNFPPHIVNWKKNDEVLPLFGRVRKSMKGALKIRFAIAEKDTGIYTCFAGSLNANSSIEFQSARKAQKMAATFEEVSDDTKKIDKTYKVSPEIIADASRTRHKKAQFLVKRWTPCSNTCGFGIQTRVVTCAIKTDSYIKMYPDETCNRIGLRKPDNIRKCVEIEKCPVWNAGEWSNCTTDYCIRDGFAVMKRLIQCISPDGSVIDHKACLKTKAPEHKRVCENPNCLALWRTEKWTGCRPYCGPTRYKFRILSCVWKHSKKPAGINCHEKPRPHFRMACESTRCINVCRDKSRYCSLVSYLKMCRYPQFRVECCRSCSNHVYWRIR